MAAFPLSTDKGSALYLYRCPAYRSPSLTDFLVNYLQSTSFSSGDFSITTITAKIDGLSPLTPYLVYVEPTSKTCLASVDDSKSKKEGGGKQQNRKNAPASSSTTSTSSSVDPATTEHFVSLCGGVPVSDWAAARCIVRYMTAAAASGGLSGESVFFDLMLHAQVVANSRVSDKEDTSTGSQKQQACRSPDTLRYTVDAALDVCEAWWVLLDKTQAQQKRGKEDSTDFLDDPVQQGYANYFASLMRSRLLSPGFDDDYLQKPYLFNTIYPTLADMALVALLQCFPRAAVLLQKAISQQPCVANNSRGVCVAVQGGRKKKEAGGGIGDEGFSLSVSEPSTITTTTTTTTITPRSSTSSTAAVTTTTTTTTQGTATNTISVSAWMERVWGALCESSSLHRNRTHNSRDGDSLPLMDVVSAGGDGTTMSSSSSGGSSSGGGGGGGGKGKETTVVVVKTPTVDATNSTIISGEAAMSNKPNHNGSSLHMNSINSTGGGMTIGGNEKKRGGGKDKLGTTPDFHQYGDVVKSHHHNNRSNNKQTTENTSMIENRRELSPSVNESGCKTPDASGAVNFLKQIVENDLRSGKHASVVTRFPPEPNGFLHLGHAKSICVNFGLANAFNGRCHLRFDDTNPMKEEMQYIKSIQRDVRWLGGDWGDHLYYASNYFEQLYDWAEVLIKKGLAFVDDDDQEEIRRKRGSITQPGENSGFRDRSVEENLQLFRRMRAGEFEEGSRVLRAKIDMAHSNMNMRDPIMYRILKKHHPRTGDKWVIYPTYDYTHGQSDSIEHITHSICTLEFELHRPLYEWFQEKLDIPRTRQIEFARLNVTNTVMSKRKLLALVVEKYVDGWDDPRLPTLAGLRRRGVPPEALHAFCDRVGVARRESVIQLELLERCIREALNPIAPRRFAIQQPLRVTITNYNEGEEIITAPNHPENSSLGSRELHFTKNLYIDRDDFMETPVPGYHRLMPGKEVRLKHAYWIKCEEVIKDAEGKNIVELRCTYDPQTKMSAAAPDGRKVKGTIQWLSDKDAAPAELRVYGRLFNKANPEEVDESAGPDASWRDHINPDSLKVYKGLVERGVTDRKLFPPQSSIQFERLGFFTPDASTLPEGNVGEENDITTGAEMERGGKGMNSTVVEKTANAGAADRTRKGASDIPVFNLTVSLQEGFTTGEDAEKERTKAQDRLAREKAALERQKKKEEREMKKLMKEKQLQQQDPESKRESAAAGQ